MKLFLINGWKKNKKWSKKWKKHENQTITNMKNENSKTKKSKEWKKKHKN